MFIHILELSITIKINKYKMKSDKVNLHGYRKKFVLIRLDRKEKKIVVESSKTCINTLERLDPQIST